MSKRSSIWRFLWLCAACLWSEPSIAWEVLNPDFGLAMIKDEKRTLPETGSEVQYSAVRLKQKGLTLDLLTLNSLLNAKYKNYGPDNVAFLDDGTRISVRPTVATAWSLLKDDPDIVGIVPIGFSELAGSADVAGFFRSDSQIPQEVAGGNRQEDLRQDSIFSAPNLDTLLCLNDVQLASQSTAAGKQVDEDVPFLFRIYPSLSTYRYVEEPLEKIDFRDAQGKSPLDPNRFKETYDQCKKMIQTGFRVVNPKYTISKESTPYRLTYGEEKGKELGKYPLNVMVFDKKGRFSFVHFQIALSPHEAGLAISSDDFFGEENCKDKSSDPDRNPGARSCEIWAVTISAFDRAGMVFRFSRDKEPKKIGNVDVISPAVLVLRERGS